MSSAQDLSFQPVWNTAGDRVAIYLTDCVDCNTFNQSDEKNLSGWLIINVELPDKDNYGNLPLVQKLSESPDFGHPFVQLESEEAGVVAAPCVDSSTEVGGDIILRLPYRNGEQYSVSQGYCSNGGSHRGFEVDFRTPSGTVLVATAPGIVTEGGADNPSHYDYPCTGISGNDQNGTNVRLLHQGKTKQWISYYLHLQYPRLPKAATIGSIFQAGEIIGYSDNTGCTTGPHLHFQMRNAINNGGNDGVRPTPMQGVELETGQSPITYFSVSKTYRAIDTSKFKNGATVEVFGTDTGLRAWTDICSGTYVVKPNGVTGTSCKDHSFVIAIFDGKSDGLMIRPKDGRLRIGLGRPRPVCILFHRPIRPSVPAVAVTVSA